MFSVAKKACNFPFAKKNIQGYFFTKINKVKKGLFFLKNDSKTKTKQNDIEQYFVINSWKQVI